MRNPNEPSAKNKRRGGIAVIAIAAAIFAIISIGLNLRTVDEADAPASAGSQTIEDAAP